MAKQKYVAVYHDGAEVEFEAEPSALQQFENSNGAFVWIGGIAVSTAGLRWVKPVAVEVRA